MSKWKKQLVDSTTAVLAGEVKPEEAAMEEEMHELHAKIGQLTVERDFLSKAWERRGAYLAGKA